MTRQVFHFEQLFPTCRFKYAVENPGSSSILSYKWNSLLMPRSLNNHWVPHQICNILDRKQGWERRGKHPLLESAIQELQVWKYKESGSLSRARTNIVRSTEQSRLNLLLSKVNGNNIWNYMVVSAHLCLVWVKQVCKYKTNIRMWRHYRIVQKISPKFFFLSHVEITF